MKYSRKELTEHLAKPNVAELYGIYTYFGRNSLHSDFVKNTHKESINDIDFDENDEVDCDLFFLDEMQFQQTIYANVNDTVNFSEWYDDSEAIVMVIVLLNK